MTANQSLTVAERALSLVAAVARLARAATTDFEIDQMLSELCHAAAAAFTADGVGVMAVDGTRTRFVQTSSPEWTPFEVLQQILQDGPCRDAVNSGRPVMADNLARIMTMWGTDFADSALTNRIQAVLAIPLLSRGRCWGTVDLYWKQRHTSDDEELAAVQFLADVAVSYLVMAADRDEARAARKQLAHQVLHDHLTGLPNRQLIIELIQHALSTAARRGTGVAVLFIDIDDFKQINDRYGHLAGDIVLKDVARRLQETIRRGDSVGRLGGDEFLVLCEDLPVQDGQGNDSTAALVTRLLAAIGRPIPIADHNLPITASIGVGLTADARKPHPSTLDLVHQADLAMYRAKNERRTRRQGNPELPAPRSQPD